MKTIKLYVVFVAMIGSLFILFGNRYAVSSPACSTNMPETDKRIIGEWQAVSSSGGFTGKGFTLDFETLILEENGSFKLMRNDSIIAGGKVSMVKEKESILSNFNFEKTADVQLALDPEKYIQVTHTDTLNLVAPCCDRYNIKLARKK